jgi:hypothetical protein
MGFTMKKNGSDKKHPFCISLLDTKQRDGTCGRPPLAMGQDDENKKPTAKALTTDGCR